MATRVIYFKPLTDNKSGIILIKIIQEIKMLSFECYDCRFFTRRDDLIEEYTTETKTGKNVPAYVGECNLFYSNIKNVICFNDFQGIGCDSWQPENEEDQEDYDRWVEDQ